MQHLIRLRKIILLAGVALTLVATAFFLLLGDPAQKLSTTIATLIAPLLAGLFIGVMFAVTRNFGHGITTVYSWFFLISGMIAFVMGLISYFDPFPAGTTPLLSVGVTQIFSVLQGQSKMNTAQ